MDFNTVVVSFGAEYEGWGSGFGQYSHEKLIFRLRASSFWDELALATGGDLMKMEGYLHLSVQDGPCDRISLPVEDDHTDNSIEVLGSLWHLPAYEGSSDGVIKPSEESFSVECWITRQAFENLRGAIRANEAPRSVHISIPKGLGLEYGSAPDGSVKKWDNSERRFLSVSGLSFAFAQQRPEQIDLDEVSNGELESDAEEGEVERAAVLDQYLAALIQQLANIRLLLIVVIAAVILTRLI